jgi:hypothetical protein
LLSSSEILSWWPTGLLGRRCREAHRGTWEEGARLLDLAPDGIRERIRRANYPRRDYIHELIVETYALLMRARIERRPGRPTWLPNEIYQLITRIGA